MRDARERAGAKRQFARQRSHKRCRPSPPELPRAHRLPARDRTHRRAEDGEPLLRQLPRHRL